MALPKTKIEQKLLLLHECQHSTSPSQQAEKENGTCKLKVAGTKLKFRLGSYTRLQTTASNNEIQSEDSPSEEPEQEKGA